MMTEAHKEIVQLVEDWIGKRTAQLLEAQRNAHTGQFPDVTSAMDQAIEEATTNLNVLLDRKGT